MWRGTFNSSWLGKNSFSNYPINYRDTPKDDQGNELLSNIITDVSITVSVDSPVVLLSAVSTLTAINFVFGCYSNGEFIPVLSLNTEKPIDITRVFALAPIANKQCISSFGYITLSINALDTFSYSFYNQPLYLQNRQPSNQLTSSIKQVNVISRKGSTQLPITMCGDIQLCGADDISVFGLSLDGVIDNLQNTTTIGLSLGSSLIRYNNNETPSTSTDEILFAKYAYSSSLIDPNAVQNINGVKPDLSGEITLNLPESFNVVNNI